LLPSLAHPMKAYGKNGGKLPSFLTSTLGGGECCALLQGKEPEYPLKGRLFGRQSQSGCPGEEMNESLALARNPTMFLLLSRPSYLAAFLYDLLLSIISLLDCKTWRVFGQVLFVGTVAVELS